MLLCMSYYEITFKIQHTKNTKKIRKINSENCHKRKKYHRNQARGHYSDRKTIRKREREKLGWWSDDDWWWIELSMKSNKINFASNGKHWHLNDGKLLMIEVISHVLVSVDCTHNWWASHRPSHRSPKVSDFA